MGLTDPHSEKKSCFVSILYGSPSPGSLQQLQLLEMDLNGFQLLQSAQFNNTYCWGFTSSRKIYINK